MPFKIKKAKFDLIDLPEVLDAANKRTANNEARSYRRTVENWDEKPSFYVEETEHHYGFSDYKVFTDSLIYLWVDEGTETHLITPNGNYPLRVKGFGNTIFSGGKAYYPKTKANKIVSSGSGEYESDDVYLWGVNQSIEARNFTLLILSKASERWEKALDTEIKKFIGKNVK